MIGNCSFGSKVGTFKRKKKEKSTLHTFKSINKNEIFCYIPTEGRPIVPSVLNMRQKKVRLMMKRTMNRETINIITERDKNMLSISDFIIHAQK